MITSMPLVTLTLRGLLDRRRTWLMLLLAAVPVLTAVAVVVAGGPTLTARIFDNLVIRTVLPLIALVFGTSALGSELEDGTIVYLLTKPIRRLRIYLAKGLVASGLTAGLVAGSMILTGIVAAGSGDALLSTAAGYAVAAALGAVAYTLVFLTLSSITSRALAFGLGYVLLWEGILSGLLEGTRVLSIRQATLGIATELTGVAPRDAVVDAGTGLAIIVVAVAGAIVIGERRLARFQLRGGD